MMIFDTGNLRAAQKWRATSERTARTAKRALEGMGLTAGRYPAAHLVEKADHWAARVEQQHTPARPTPLTEIDAALYGEG